MNVVSRLLGRSTTTPLQVHMERVQACVGALGEMLSGLLHGSLEDGRGQAGEISELEHRADLVKHDIRESMPRVLFLSVDRQKFLDILGTQDAIADKAEELGVLLTLRPLTMFGPMREDFEAFVARNMEAFDGVRAVVESLDGLAQLKPGGQDANRIDELVQSVALHEHDAAVIRRGLLRTLFSHEEAFSKADFLLWRQLFDELADIGKLSEKLANRIGVAVGIH